MVSVPSGILPLVLHCSPLVGPVLSPEQNVAPKEPLTQVSVRGLVSSELVFGSSRGGAIFGYADRIQVTTRSNRPTDRPTEIHPRRVRGCSAFAFTSLPPPSPRPAKLLLYKSAVFTLLPKQKNDKHRNSLSAVQFYGVFFPSARCVE